MVKEIDMNIKPLENCVCCGGSYERYKTRDDGSDDENSNYYSCILPVMENGVVKEAKGLCPTCNIKSEVWYNPALKCHNPNAINYGPCYHKKGYLRGHCHDCGAIESVVEYHRKDGYLYLGNGIKEKI